MTSIEIHGTSKETSAQSRQQGDQPVFRHVLACVDSSPLSRNALAHAAAVARSMGARLTVMRVLEPAADQQAPTDPVDWTLRHRVAEAELRDHAAQFGGASSEAVVVDGQAAEKICDWIHDHDVDLTVLGVGGDSNWHFAGLGATARRIAETAEGSVLLAPFRESGGKPVRYRRVMTPLDGSPRAECALPIAVSIAGAHGAEIVLVHAAPNIDLTETGPLEPEAFALRDRLRRRNERVGAQYLRKVQSWLPASQARSQTRLMASGDPRHAIEQAARETDADLIVLSSTGLSGHPDITLGSVADFLINRASTPILLVRGRDFNGARTPRHGEDMQSLRFPTGGLS